MLLNTYIAYKTAVVEGAVVGTVVGAVVGTAVGVLVETAVRQLWPSQDSGVVQSSVSSAGDVVGDGCGSCCAWLP